VGTDDALHLGLNLLGQDTAGHLLEKALVLSFQLLGANNWGQLSDTTSRVGRGVAQ
jgi:hypothetical protein